VTATGLLLALAFLAAAPPAVAQTTYWLRGGTNSSLGTASNWALDTDNTTTSTVVPGTNDVLVIGITARNDIPINRLTMGGSNRAFGSLVLSNSGDNYILRVSDAGATNNNFVALTLLNGITNSAVAGNFYIGDEGRNVNLRLGNTDEDFAIANESSSSVTFQQRVELASTTSSNRTMVVSGAGSGTTFFQGGIANGGTGGAVLSLRIDTAGTVSIGTSTSGSFSGGTTLAAGTMAVNGTDVLGTGGLSINGGTIAATGAARSLTNSITVGGNFALGGSGQALTLSGPINLGGGSRTVTVNGADLTTWSGTVSDGALVKAGSGTLVLQGTSTFGGGVMLESGTLGVRNSTGALGTGTLTINGGTLASVIVPRTVANNISVGGNFALGGLANAITLSGAVDLNGQTRTITLNNSATITGVISNGSLLLDNPDPTRFLELTAANTFTNATVNGGILRLSGSGSFQSSGAVDLEGSRGAATFDIAGITAGAVTIGSLAGSTNSSVQLGNKELVVGANNVSTIFAGQISGGAGSLRKTGLGTLTLSGDSSYSGSTTVEAGRLLVNGAVTNSALTVQSGATLGGSGAVGATTILAGGIISPGNSPGTLTNIGNLTWNAGGGYDWEIFNVAGSPGSAWDYIEVTDQLILGGLSATNPFTINIFSVTALPSTIGPLAGWSPLHDYSWTILTAANGIVNFDPTHFTLNLVNFTNYNSLGGGLFSLVQDGSDLNLIFTSNSGPGPEPIPELGSWLAACFLVVITAALRRRRRLQAVRLQVAADPQPKDP
jgi:fibronectin-binding autotransporter adhesin